MFEHKHHPLISRRAFALRMLRSVSAAAALVAISLFGGAAGYHFLEGIPWLDATLNASMILTGMGPVAVLQTDGGKIFAIGYSLFSGMLFLTLAAFLLAPVFHRFLHRFHLERGSN